MDETLLTNLRTSYNRTAVSRNQADRQAWKAVERARFLKLLQEENKKSLLEIGAGPGWDSLFFQENGLDVTATDLSPEMVRLCQEKGLKAYEMHFDQLEFDEPFDAIYALNCLLHVPKKQLPHILKRLQILLEPEGLFYMGVYGGEDFEGIYEDDFQEPKRFFSLYSSQHIQTAVGQFFNLVYFEEVPTGQQRQIFQSMIWRNGLASS